MIKYATVGDLKNFIKDIPDDAKVYVSNEYFTLPLELNDMFYDKEYIEDEELMGNDPYMGPAFIVSRKF